VQQLEDTEQLSRSCKSDCTNHSPAAVAAVVVVAAAGQPVVVAVVAAAAECSVNRLNY